MVIEKKQFWGDRDLTHYVVPRDVTEIGDWAFAGCRELVWVAIPETVRYVGREAFASCDKLKAVYYYRKDTEHKEEKYAELLALALRFFPSNSELVASRKEGCAVWLQAWDAACKSHLESADDLGYRPFWAGGEEDYEDENKAYLEYCRMTRFRKAEVVLQRLLAEDMDGMREYFLKKLCENDMSLELLKGKIDHPARVVQIFEESGLLTGESCREILDAIPRESVELRSLLLLKTGNFRENNWEDWEV